MTYPYLPIADSFSLLSLTSTDYTSAASSASNGGDAVEELTAQLFTILSSPQSRSFHSSVRSSAQDISNRFNAMKQLGVEPARLNRFAKENLPLLKGIVTSMKISADTLRQESSDSTYRCQQFNTRLANANVSALQFEEPSQNPYCTSIGSLLPTQPALATMSACFFEQAIEKNDNGTQPMPANERTPANPHARQEAKTFQNNLNVNESLVPLIQGHMAEVHIAAKGVELVGDVVAGAAKVIFCGGPGGEERCKSTLKLAREYAVGALDAVGLKEPVKEGIRYLKSCDGSTTAEYLIANGVPPQEAKAQAQQYMQDVGTIAVAAVAPPVLKGATRLFARTGAARGAGKVTVLSPGEAVPANMIDVTPAPAGISKITHRAGPQKLLPGGRTNQVQQVLDGLNSAAKTVAPSSSLPAAVNSTLGNTSSQMRYCGKGECAGTFIRDMKEFTTVPAFISRELKRDLVLVQFHGPGAVGVDRSHNWWMIAIKANRLHTLSEVMDKAGLLSAWGERTHVTVARIPKGEQLTSLLGKAREQIDTATGEMRPGGAIQMRIKGFKPEWIVETRKIPGTEIVELETKNDKVLKIMQKCYPQLAISEKNHLGLRPGEKADNSFLAQIGALENNQLGMGLAERAADVVASEEPRLVHSFEVPLDLPDGSLMADRRLRMKGQQQEGVPANMSDVTGTPTGDISAIGLLPELQKFLPSGRTTEVQQVLNGLVSESHVPASPQTLVKTPTTVENMKTRAKWEKEASRYELNSLKYVDNPAYKRVFAKAQEKELAKEQALLYKRKFGLVRIEQKVARTQIINQGYKKDWALLKKMSTDTPIKMPLHFEGFFQNMDFKSTMQSRGVFLSKSIGNDTFYYIPGMKRQVVIHGNRLSKALASSLQRAESNGVKRQFITFDPQAYSIKDMRDLMSELPKTIVGIGEISRGEFYPFIIMEIK